MPVRYRKDTALKLLSDMNNFKSDILDTAKTALIDAKNIQEWNDKKYDVFPWWKDAIEYTDDCIIHYTIGKPWKMYNGDIDNFYWKYLFETLWSEDLLTYLHYVRDAPDIQKSISLIQKNFFGIIDGSRVDKVKCAVSLSFSIWSEFIIGILKIVRPKIHS